MKNRYRYRDNSREAFEYVVQAKRYQKGRISYGFIAALFLLSALLFLLPYALANWSTHG